MIYLISLVKHHVTFGLYRFRKAIKRNIDVTQTEEFKKIHLKLFHIINPLTKKEKKNDLLLLQNQQIYIWYFFANN